MTFRKIGCINRTESSNEVLCRYDIAGDGSDHLLLVCRNQMLQLTRQPEHHLRVLIQKLNRNCAMRPKP